MQTSEKITSREAQRLATRERVFASAVAEFKRSGVANADVSAIVAEAGVAHGTFFFHFPTKEHVVAELGHREEVRVAAEIERFLNAPRDLRATLMEVIRRSESLERRVGTTLFKDLLALYFSPSRPELQLWTDHPLISRIHEEFERTRSAGGVDADGEVDPDNSAIFFFVGLYALFVTYDRGAERSAVLEQYVNVLLRGLGLR